MYGWCNIIKNAFDDNNVNDLNYKIYTNTKVTSFSIENFYLIMGSLCIRQCDWFLLRTVYESIDQSINGYMIMTILHFRYRTFRECLKDPMSIKYQVLMISQWCFLRWKSGFIVTIFKDSIFSFLFIESCTISCGWWRQIQAKYPDIRCTSRVNFGTITIYFIR